MTAKPKYEHESPLYQHGYLDGLIAGREIVVLWMMEHSYATGHGDTIEPLLVELVGQAREAMRREIVQRHSDSTLEAAAIRSKEARAK